MSRKPTPQTRVLSHLLVAAAVAVVVRKKAGIGGAIVSAIVATLAHEEFDAPVAQALTEAGL